MIFCKPLSIASIAVFFFSTVGTTTAAHAQGLRPDGVFVEGGVAEYRTYSATAGAVWDWSWRTQWLGGEVTARTEALASHISPRSAEGVGSVTLLAVVPVIRYRFSDGSSPWFVEGGIGASLTDGRYKTANREFSTRLNFYDVASVGRSFGAGRKSELSLRLLHISNAGIKRPNPGEDFLQLRYTRLF
jgi:lipid A 3-O-deacylase